MGEMRERMLRGELYIAEDAESAAEFGRIQDLLARVNGVAPGAWDGDVAPVTIGTACQIATRVQLLTATHPIDPEPRRIGWEYAEPISAARIRGGADLRPVERLADEQRGLYGFRSPPGEPGPGAPGIAWLRDGPPRCCVCLRLSDKGARDARSGPNRMRRRATSRRRRFNASRHTRSADTSARSSSDPRVPAAGERPA